MTMRRKLLVGTALLCAALAQGCAVFYATDTVNPGTGTTEREYGFLGGCLPLYHYHGTRPPAAPAQPPAGVSTNQPAATAPAAH